MNKPQHITLFLFILITSVVARGQSEEKKLINLKDSVILEGQFIKTNSIRLSSPKSILQNESIQFLDSLISFLEKHDSLIIAIDHYGHHLPAQSSTSLSQKAAETISSYLIDQGIYKDRLIARGYHLEGKEKDFTEFKILKTDYFTSESR